MANEATLFARGNSWILQGIESWLPELRKNYALTAAIRKHLVEIAQAHQYSMIALFGPEGTLSPAIGWQDAEAHGPQALRAIQSQLPTWFDLHRNANETMEFEVLTPIQPEGQPPQGVL